MFICSWEPTVHYFINSTSILALQSRTKELNSHNACLLPSLWYTGSQCVCCQCIVCLCVWSMIVLVHWETLLNDRVPQMSRTPPGSLLRCTLCVHGHSYTPIPVPVLVWVLEFAPTNRHTHRHTNSQNHQVFSLWHRTCCQLRVCLATTLIGQPSNPHQFLGSPSDSPEPMRCRRGRWTWESPNQIPRSDQSRSLFCCMSYVWWLWPI